MPSAAASRPLPATRRRSPSDFIGRWMSQIAPAADAIATPKTDWEAYLRQLEFASVELSLKNLMTFPFVKRRWRRASCICTAPISGVARGELLVSERRPTAPVRAGRRPTRLCRGRFRCQAPPQQASGQIGQPAMRVGAHHLDHHLHQLLDMMTVVDRHAGLAGQPGIFLALVRRYRLFLRRNIGAIIGEGELRHRRFPAPVPPRSRASSRS